jgi:ribosomal protein S18 acetylase RimI-like enzyme
MPRDESPSRPTLRTATLLDLPRLVALEEASFAGNRIARRSWSQLLRGPSALVFVAEHSDEIVGALVLLFRQTSCVARVYSIAVAARHRGTGIGRALMEIASLAVAARGCTCMRLETRLDNHPAQALFARLGYTVTGQTAGYYEDGMAALRLERPIAAPTPN